MGVKVCSNVTLDFVPSTHETRTIRRTTQQQDDVTVHKVSSQCDKCGAVSGQESPSSEGGDTKRLGTMSRVRVS
jgi:hypothetical protein